MPGPSIDASANAAGTSMIDRPETSKRAIAAVWKMQLKVSPTSQTHAPIA